MPETRHELPSVFCRFKPEEYAADIVDGQYIGALDAREHRQGGSR